MNSYDVRFWDIKKVSDTAKGRWRVRWGVASAALQVLPRPADRRRVPRQPQKRGPRPPAVRPGHRAARYRAGARRCRRPDLV